MVTISINNVTTQQSAGVTLSGSAPSTSVLEWWVNDAVVHNTYGFVRTGTTWALDVRALSNSFIINVQATYEGIKSNIVTHSVNTGAASPEVSFQYNEFDELSALNAVDRIPGETNESLRLRALEASVNVPNSSKLGIINSVERDLGLPTLNPLFALSLRFSHINNRPYVEAVIDFRIDGVEVQFTDWTVVDELLNIDITHNTARLSKSIGGEIGDNLIRVTNGNHVVPDRAIIVLEDNIIKIDPLIFKVDFSKDLLCTYPYKEELKYITTNPTTNERSIKTVADVKSWITGVRNIVDDYGNTSNAIVWNDGYLNEVVGDVDVTGQDVRNNVQDAIDNPPTTKYVKLTASILEEVYEYINVFPAKGFFSSEQIIPVGVVVLSNTPEPFKGSWMLVNYIHDEVFVDKITAEKESPNLEYYAGLLRDHVRMGIKKAIVNYDYWGADSPEVIGNTFIKAHYDRGKSPHTILTDEGNVQQLTLNQRRYYASKLAILHR